MKKVLDVRVLNKSSNDNKQFFLKKLNLLHDVIIHLGYLPDGDFIGDLEFPEGKADDDLKTLAGAIDTEVCRVGWYIDYLEGCILNNLDLVSDTDLCKMYLFYKSNEDINDYLVNVINKSEKCPDCEVDEYNVIKTSKVVRNALGQYMKEE